MKWNFCQCCFRDGHCENQDRGHKCETYPKQLEDKVERLQEQLEIATKALKEINEKYRFTVAQEVVYKALEEINKVEE